MTKNDFFKTICKISRSFGTTIDKDEILQLIVQSVIDTMKCKAACLWLANEETDEFVPVAQTGLSEEYLHEPLHMSNLASIITKDGFLYAQDATSDPRLEHHEAKIKEGVASILIVPVLVKGKLIGTLSVFTAKTRKFTEDEIEFLTALAEQGGMAIEQARLVEKITQNAKLFQAITISINSSLDIKEILHIISADIARAIGVTAASVGLFNDNKNILELVASYGLSNVYINNPPPFIGKIIARVQKGEIVSVLDVSKDKGIQNREVLETEGINSILNTPIKIKNEVIGVLRLYSRVPREFTKDEIALVSALALQGGLAIQNASMYLRLQSDMEDLQEDIWSHRSWF